MLFATSPSHNFLETVLLGLLERYSAQEYADTEIFFPTHRAKQAFQALWGERVTSLCPKTKALTDITPSHIDAYGRRILSPAEMQCAIAEWIESEAIQAPRQFAQTLYRLANDCDHYAVSMPALASHWAATSDDTTREWLARFCTAWPQWLENTHTTSSLRAYRTQIEALVEQWDAIPPKFPVIIAGSTASLPATGLLISCVNALEKGAIIFPALYDTLDANYHAALSPLHPFHTTEALSTRCNQSLASAPLWYGEIDPPTHHRRYALTEILRPASISEAWQHLPKETSLPPVTRIECEDLLDEAKTIVAQIEQTDATQRIHVIAHDHALLTQISWHLTHTSIPHQYTCPTPLLHTPSLRYMQQIWERMREESNPIALLSLMKHPWVGMHYPRDVWETLTYRFEKTILRGVRVASSMSGITSYIATQKDPELFAWCQAFENACMPLALCFKNNRARFAEWNEALEKSARALSRHETVFPDAQEDAAQAWQNFCAQRIEKPMDYAQYQTLFELFFTATTQNQPIDPNARIQLLTPLDARLLNADLHILGSMNEGTWPPNETQELWRSAAIGERFGFPSSAQATAKALLDYVHYSFAPSLIFTRARKTRGEINTASRIWQRIERIEARTGIAPRRALSAAEIRKHAHIPRPPSVPCEISPPLALRPREFSATSFTRLMRDPYGFYARYLLRLKPLEALDEDPNRADFGNCVHRTLERIITECRTDTPETRRKKAQNILAEICADHSLIHSPIVKMLWKPRIWRIIEWYLSYLQTHPETIADTQAEATLHGTLTIGDISYRFSATLDRLEKRNDGIRITDYKTGTPPSESDMKKGIEPQLPIEAWLSVQNLTLPLLPLEIWHMRGGREPVEPHILRTLHHPETIQTIEENLRAILTYFTQEDALYRAVPDSKRAPRFNDYTHLERI